MRWSNAKTEGNSIADGRYFCSRGSLIRAACAWKLDGASGRCRGEFSATAFTGQNFFVAAYRREGRRRRCEEARGAVRGGAGDGQSPAVARLPPGSCQGLEEARARTEQSCVSEADAHRRKLA